MIAIKTGTQTFSKSSVPSALSTTNLENVTNNISASDKEKYFKGKDLGEILNKVADPNWVDKSKMRKTAGNNGMDKEAFLKLLLTQLQNQDPTSPMKSHEMSAQLAQFSSLEQLTNIDRSINKMVKSQNPAINFDTLNMIGKAVAGDSSKIYRTNTEDPHSISFDLKTDAVSATIKIKDATGQVIRVLDQADIKKGKNEIQWNGKLENGTNARPGTYTVEISAKSSNGKSVFAETKFKGTVSGVNFTAEGPMLLIGKKKVKLSEVKTIIDPSQIKNSDKDVSKALKEGSATVGPDKNAANNLQSVGMSRGLINKVKNNGIETGTN